MTDEEIAAGRAGAEMQGAKPKGRKIDPWLKLGLELGPVVA